MIRQDESTIDVGHTETRKKYSSVGLTKLTRRRSTINQSIERRVMLNINAVRRTALCYWSRQIDQSNVSLVRSTLERSSPSRIVVFAHRTDIELLDNKLTEADGRIQFNETVRADRTTTRQSFDRKLSQLSERDAARRSSADLRSLWSISQRNQSR